MAQLTVGSSRWWDGTRARVDRLNVTVDGLKLAMGATDACNAADGVSELFSPSRPRACSLYFSLLGSPRVAVALLGVAFGAKRQKS